MKNLLKKLGSKINIILSGLFVGALSGLFGGGGGMLAVPILTSLMGMEAKNAHATALVVMLPITIVSFVVYSFSGNIEWDIMSYVVLGVAIGGAVGALILNKLSNILLSIVFYVIMILAGLKMILQR